MTKKCADILLVEDNADDVLLTKRALKRNNIANHMVVVSDGQEALDFLYGKEDGTSKMAPVPCLILLDLKLPKVSGLEVLQRVRSEERTRLTPVVVLTTSSEERDLVESYSLGANSYVRKPVDFNEFVEAVQQLGMYWLLLNEPAPSPKD
jgi:CheY-like chemotaxis protein